MRIERIGNQEEPEEELRTAIVDLNSEIGQRFGERLLEAFSWEPREQSPVEPAEDEETPAFDPESQEREPGGAIEEIEG